MEKWLERARNKNGRMIRFDKTTLLASHGKFARVCVDIDLTNPLKGATNSEGNCMRFNLKDSMSFVFIVEDMDIECLRVHQKFSHKVLMGVSRIPRRVWRQPQRRAMKVQERHLTNKGSQHRVLG